MPCLLKIAIVKARGLPAMDYSTQSCDAYCIVEAAGETHKTEVCRQTRDPEWNFNVKLEVEDEEMLWLEPLRVNVMDKDIVSTDDSIGVVSLPLATLLARAAVEQSGTAVTDIAPSTTVSSTPSGASSSGFFSGPALSLGSDVSPAPHAAGWFPIIDSLRGQRGQLWVELRVQAFSAPDFAQVQFHTSSHVDPQVYPQVWVRGFLEELAVGPDPEYGLIDSFRTSRASNTRRSAHLARLAAQARLSIAKKAASTGANAVIGFMEDFDVEGASGVVARAYGTAVYLVHRSGILPDARVPLDAIQAAVTAGREGGVPDSAPQADVKAGRQPQADTTAGIRVSHPNLPGHMMCIPSPLPTVGAGGFSRWSPVLPDSAFLSGVARLRDAVLGIGALPRLAQLDSDPKGVVSLSAAHTAYRHRRFFWYVLRHVYKEGLRTSTRVKRKLGLKGGAGGLTMRHARADTASSAGSDIAGVTSGVPRTSPVVSGRGPTLTVPPSPSLRLARASSGAIGSPMPMPALGSNASPDGPMGSPMSTAGMDATQPGGVWGGAKKNAGTLVPLLQLYIPSLPALLCTPATAAASGQPPPYASPEGRRLLDTSYVHAALTASVGGQRLAAVVGVGSGHLFPTARPRAVSSAAAGGGGSGGGGAAESKAAGTPTGSPRAMLHAAAAAFDESDGVDECLIDVDIPPVMGLWSRHRLNRRVQTPADVQLMTLRHLPPNARVTLGGMVGVRSVKYLGGLRAKTADREVRDRWWSELRGELRAHAYRLRCTHVLGYNESTHIAGDAVVLSVVGTAARVRNLSHMDARRGRAWQRECADVALAGVAAAANVLVRTAIQSGKQLPPLHEIPALTTEPLQWDWQWRWQRPCSVLHVPFHHRAAAFNQMRLRRCRCCGRGYVHETLLSNTELPQLLPISGEPQLLTATVARDLDKTSTGEALCSALSKELVFLEQAVHQQLLLKMRLAGANAAFAVRSQVLFSESQLVATMSATAVACDALPPAPAPTLRRSEGMATGVSLGTLAALEKATTQLQGMLALPKGKTADAQQLVWLRAAGRALGVAVPTAAPVGVGGGGAAMPPPTTPLFAPVQAPGASPSPIFPASAAWAPAQAAGGAASGALVPTSPIAQPAKASTAALRLLLCELLAATARDARAGVVAAQAAKVSAARVMYALCDIDAWGHGCSRGHLVQVVPKDPPRYPTWGGAGEHADPIGRPYLSPRQASAPAAEGGGPDRWHPSLTRAVTEGGVVPPPASPMPGLASYSLSEMPQWDGDAAPLDMLRGHSLADGVLPQWGGPGTGPSGEASTAAAPWWAEVESLLASEMLPKLHAAWLFPHYFPLKYSRRTRAKRKEGAVSIFSSTGSSTSGGGAGGLQGGSNASVDGDTDGGSSSSSSSGLSSASSSSSSSSSSSDDDLGESDSTIASSDSSSVTASDADSDQRHSSDSEGGGVDDGGEEFGEGGVDAGAAAFDDPRGAHHYVFELDDEQEEDRVAAALLTPPPRGVTVVSTDGVPRGVLLVGSHVPTHDPQPMVALDETASTHGRSTATDGTEGGGSPNSEPANIGQIKLDDAPLGAVPPPKSASSGGLLNLLRSATKGVPKTTTPSPLVPTDAKQGPPTNAPPAVEAGPSSLSDMAAAAEEGDDQAPALPAIPGALALPGPLALVSPLLSMRSSGGDGISDGSEQGGWLAPYYARRLAREARRLRKRERRRRVLDVTWGHSTASQALRMPFLVKGGSNGATTSEASGECKSEGGSAATALRGCGGVFTTAPVLGTYSHDDNVIRYVSIFRRFDLAEVEAEMLSEAAARAEKVRAALQRLAAGTPGQQSQAAAMGNRAVVGPGASSDRAHVLERSTSSGWLTRAFSWIAGKGGESSSVGGGASGGHGSYAGSKSDESNAVRRRETVRDVLDALMGVEGGLLAPLEVSQSDVLAKVTQTAQAEMWQHVQERLSTAPCALVGVTSHIDLPAAGIADILLTGVLLHAPPAKPLKGVHLLLDSQAHTSDLPSGTSKVLTSATAAVGVAFNALQPTLGTVDGHPPAAVVSPAEVRMHSSGSGDSALSPIVTWAVTSTNALFGGGEGGVRLTPMSCLPGRQVTSYVGRISFALVRETSSSGGRDSQAQDFLQGVLAEVQAMAAAEVLALGGDALLSVQLVPRESQGSSGGEGHVYHLITVAGDAARTQAV